MVPLNPGDFMIRGLWPHSQASLWLTGGRDLTGVSSNWVLGGFCTITPVFLITTLRVSSGSFPRSGPCSRIPVHVTISGTSGGTNRREWERKEPRKGVVSDQDPWRGAAVKIGCCR